MWLKNFECKITVFGVITQYLKLMPFYPFTKSRVAKKD